MPFRDYLPGHRALCREAPLVQLGEVTLVSSGQRASQVDRGSRSKHVLEVSGTGVEALIPVHLGNVQVHPSKSDFEDTEHLQNGRQVWGMLLEEALDWASYEVKPRYRA